jgi:hypothetical protein
MNVSMTWRAVFGAAALLELASFLTFLAPSTRPYALGIAAAFAVFLAVRDLRGLFGWLLLDAVVASHGHLLFVEHDGTRLTLRMILFVALAFGWLVRQAKNRGESLLHLRRDGLLWPLALVIAAVAWGVIRGLMLGRGFGAVVDDGNAYAFLLVVPIALDLAGRREDFSWLTRVFAGAALWLSVKSLLLLYAFTHGAQKSLPDLYRWQRTYWLTEITPLGGGGWYRVFAASDVFLIVAVLVGGLLLSHRHSRRLFAWTATAVAAFLLSMSRSFWLGATVGAAAGLFLALRRRMLDIKDAFRLAAGFLVLGIAGAAFVGAAALFPLPAPTGSDAFFGAFGSRFGASDAAVSSRWKQLPPLEEAIGRSPILGSGFGAAITYRSDDPRIQDLYPDGVITTPAIEWQYLEIWLKTGLLGLAAVAWLWWAVGRKLVAATEKAAGSDRPLSIAFFMSFMAFVAANVFTPYVNHPLGWMFIAVLIAGADVFHSKTAPIASA